MFRQVVLCALAFLLPLAEAHAQALTPPPPVELTLEAPDQLDPSPRKGSRGAEYGAAILGEALMVSISGVAFLSGFQEDARLDSHERAMLTQAARPVMLGGLVSAFGRRSGGEGRAGSAMLGAMPGTALVVLGLWMLPQDRIPPGGSVTVWMLGHASSLIGAVAAYRHSAAASPALERVTPGAFVDRDRVGVSLSGRF